MQQTATVPDLFAFKGHAVPASLRPEHFVKSSLVKRRIVAFPVLSHDAGKAVGAETESPGKGAEDGAVAGRLQAPPPPWQIIHEWFDIRGGRRLPLVMDLDAHPVLAAWPDSLLFRVLDGEDRPLFELVRTCSTTDRENEDVPFVERLLVDWIMTLASQSIREAKPVHEVAAMEADEGDIAYGVVALPFGTGDLLPDHAVCHVYRTDGQAVGRLPNPRKEPMHWDVALAGEPEPSAGRRDAEHRARRHRKPTRKRFTFRLNAEQHAHLKRVAESLAMSRQKLLLAAMEGHLAQLGKG